MCVHVCLSMWESEVGKEREEKRLRMEHRKLSSGQYSE